MRGAIYAAASFVVLLGFAMLHGYGWSWAAVLCFPAGLLGGQALREWGI